MTIFTNSRSHKTGTAKSLAAVPEAQALPTVHILTLDPFLRGLYS